MIFTQPVPSSGLAHSSAMSGISRFSSGSRSLRPARAMSRSVSNCGSSVAPALGQIVELRSISGFSFAGAAASFSRSSRFGLVERRGRIGMHGHGRIAEHRLGPRGGDRHVRRLAGLGIDHRIAEVPEMALRRSRGTPRRR